MVYINFIILITYNVILLLQSLFFNLRKKQYSIQNSILTRKIKLITKSNYPKIKFYAILNIIWAFGLLRIFFLYIYNYEVETPSNQMS